MKIAGIIAEYNPFHLGHAYHIEATRRMGYSHIVCILSGPFVQRGDLSVASKWARTAMALQCGADLVIELPLPFALAPAERFARSGVALLEGLGCVDAISFGSETGRLEPLYSAADLLDGGKLDDEIRSGLAQGLSYAAARQRAAAAAGDKEATGCLSRPNDILGVEYLRALRRMDSRIRPVCVGRRGAGHDGKEARDGVASASYLRSLWRCNSAAGEGYLPLACRKILQEEAEAGRFPVFLEGLEPALMGLLRSASKEQIAVLPDLSEGLENRLWKAIREGLSLQDIFALAQTKRYPLARIRRLCLNLALGVTRQDWHSSPAYLRVLGFGPRGKELLRRAKAAASLPVVFGAGDIVGLPPDAARQYAIECRAADLYTLGYASRLPCGSDQRHKLVVIDFNELKQEAGR